MPLEPGDQITGLEQKRRRPDDGIERRDERQLLAASARREGDFDAGAGAREGLRGRRAREVMAEHEGAEEVARPVRGLRSGAPRGTRTPPSRTP